MLSDDRDEDVGSDGDPDLGLDGVLGSSVERLDAQVLFDPFEEELDLPAGFVELADGQRGQIELIGQEDQALVDLGIEVANASQRVWVIFGSQWTGQQDRLIALESCGLVDRTGVEAAGPQVAFGPDDEERLRLMQVMQALEVQVSPVHDVEGSWLGDQEIADLHIVDFSVGNLDKSGNRASQIEEGVQLDGPLLFAESSPGKKGQAQIDRGGIERINGLIQLESKILAPVECARSVDENLSEVGVDAPIADFVGVSQRIARDRASDAHVIEFVLHRAQAGLDVAEALAIRHLRKTHAEELIQAGEALGLVIALITVDALSELVQGKELHDLGEEGLAGIHWACLLENGRCPMIPSSNRLRDSWVLTC